MSSGAGRGRRARQRSGLGPRRGFPRRSPRRCRSPARLCVRPRVGARGQGQCRGPAVPPLRSCGFAPGQAPLGLCRLRGAVGALSGVCHASLTRSSSSGAAPSGSTCRAPRPCAASPSPSLAVPPARGARCFHRNQTCPAPAPQPSLASVVLAPGPGCAVLAPYARTGFFVWSLGLGAGALFCCGAQLRQIPASGLQETRPCADQRSCLRCEEQKPSDGFSSLSLKCQEVRGPGGCLPFVLVLDPA